MNSYALRQPHIQPGDTLVAQGQCPQSSSKGPHGLNWPRREANSLTWVSLSRSESSGQMVYGSVGQLHPVKRQGPGGMGG